MPLLLIVVVSVAVVVDVVEHSLWLLLLLLRAAHLVLHRIQRPGPGLGTRVQAAPAGGRMSIPGPVVKKRIIITAQGAAEGGPAPIDPLQGHVSTVQNRVTGGTVARP